MDAALEGAKAHALTAEHEVLGEAAARNEVVVFVRQLLVYRVDAGENLRVMGG
jgi:hypothetical protein